MNFGYPKVQAGDSHRGVAQIRNKKKKKRKTFMEKTYSPQKLSPHCTFLKKIHYSQIKNETHDYDSDSITFFQPASIFKFFKIIFKYFKQFFKLF